MKIGLGLVVGVLFIAGCSSSNEPTPIIDPSPTEGVIDTETPGEVTGATAADFQRNWDIVSYSLSDGISREPNTQYANLILFDTNTFSAGYYCGGVEGNYTIDSGILTTTDASSIDAVIQCNAGGLTNNELNELMRSTLFNTTSMVEIVNDQLVITSILNETITFSEFSPGEI